MRCARGAGGGCAVVLLVRESGSAGATVSRARAIRDGCEVLPSARRPGGGCAVRWRAWGVGEAAR
jgi:hypothetical protein